MSELDGGRSQFFSLRLMAAGVLGAAGLFLIIKHKTRLFRAGLPNPANVHIVNTSEECLVAVETIRTKVSRYKVVGFDCEWVTQNGIRHPIALLQLASLDGYCALIRLSKIQHVPKELKAFLQDPTVLKVGVAPVDDAKYLNIDYAVRVDGMVDLRYLSMLLSEKPEGLSGLAKKYLNVTLDKDWHVRCSDWEAATLSARQINYAAADAHTAIVIFKKMLDKILWGNSIFSWLQTLNENYWKKIENICSQFINMKFKANYSNSDSFRSLLSEQQRFGRSNIKSQTRSYSQIIKNKTPYQNCYMKTSGGEILCTCERKKAEWYVEKGLAKIIDSDPFTIELNFEPAGKSVGDVGRFYTMPRANQCVVCGVMHSYIRKNVIPKEYRRLFPTVMKDHSSHDVLLLCLVCHQKSNMKDQLLRMRLANTCNAPIGTSKLIECFEIKKVKSAARALLMASTKHSIPKERREELESILREHHPQVIDLNDDFLRHCSNLVDSFENPSYQPHGEIVVDYFKKSEGGLLSLETLWREHFIQTMEPRFMPDLWSTTHTKSRLEIRAVEGRVDDDDLIVAGLRVKPPTNNVLMD